MQYRELSKLLLLLGAVTLLVDQGVLLPTSKGEPTCTCSTPKPPTAQEGLANADIVFRGTLLSREPQVGAPIPADRFVMNGTELWKGPITNTVSILYCL